ncbi:putative cucumisin [Helianthus annuus]|nr:putative cucumisin [Helianthus annuus]KAJ0461063.1 putative cucumisin [Helianthus annuus]KAJ0641485.1 putative cucumisin [Helianthus annuus]
MLSMFDIFILFARKAGVLVVQAAGNRGPEPYTTASYSPWAVGVAACDTDRTYPGSLFLGNGKRTDGIGLSAPSYGKWLGQSKLVLAKDAMLATGNFPRTQEFIEECQHPEALDPVIVQQSIVICMFSAGFANGSASLPVIMNTARTLGFAAFVFVANHAYGDVFVVNHATVLDHLFSWASESLLFLSCWNPSKFCLSLLITNTNLLKKKIRKCVTSIQRDKYRTESTIQLMFLGTYNTNTSKSGTRKRPK